MLGSIDFENMQLLNEAERIALRNRPLYTPFDVLLVAAFLFPKECIKTKRTYSATIELNGFHTRGQMVFNRKIESDEHNVNVIETMDENEIKRLLLWTASP